VSVFVTTPIENPMFCSGLAFHSWQSPGTHEECIRKAKALRLPTLRELIDLKWDSDSKERSLAHGASTAPPYLR
jgi:hypothetical protein